jgi:tRNA(Met) C34 N-acetyltransferase TmcA
MAMRVNLTPAQALAYDQLLPFLEGRHEACLAVLEGYAGTGKTFLVARLLGALTGLKIAVAAPTNKAVRVLRDKLAEVDVEIAESGDANDGWKPRLPVAGCSCRRCPSRGYR